MIFIAQSKYNQYHLSAIDKYTFINYTTLMSCIYFQLCTLIVN